MFPLAVCHSRHRRIVVQTCIIHHNLNGPGVEEITKGRCRRRSIDDIERRHAGCTAVCNDFVRHLLSGFSMPMRMDNHGVPISRQPLADDRPYGSASSRDERTLLGHHRGALTKIDARPSMSVDVWCKTVK